MKKTNEHTFVSNAYHAIQIDFSVDFNSHIVYMQIKIHHINGKMNWIVV